MNLKGFPHSEIPGSKLVCSSPGLIAAYRVLHRLLAPRHSPYALSSLTTSVSNSRDYELCDSQQRQFDLFSHCVDLIWQLDQCSKRTTVCRIFSCQRTADALARFSVTRLQSLAALVKHGGEYRARTGDLLVANQALSQLS
jgi:hypothetical protein